MHLSPEGTGGCTANPHRQRRSRDHPSHAGACACAPPHPYGTVWDMHLCYTGKKYTFLPWPYRSFPSSITVEAFLVVSISERLILLHVVLFSEGPEVKCARLVSVISARVPNKWLSAHSVLCLPLSAKVVLALCTHLDLRGRERRVLAEVLQKCFKAVNFASPVSPVSSTPSISSLQKLSKGCLPLSLLPQSCVRGAVQRIGCVSMLLCGLYPWSSPPPPSLPPLPSSGCPVPH